VDADNAAARPNAEGAAPSSAWAAAADSSTIAVAVVEEVAEDAASAGETTSLSATVMRRFRSSLSGLSWRRLTSLAWPS
jgi:hypothetical protein